MITAENKQKYYKSTNMGLKTELQNCEIHMVTFKTPNFDQIRNG